jgi:hypothetical protein
MAEQILTDAEIRAISTLVESLDAGLPKGPWEVNENDDEAQVFIGPAKVNKPGYLKGFKALLFKVEADELALFDDEGTEIPDPEAAIIDVARFCANSRQDVPRLVATIAHLKEEMSKAAAELRHAYHVVRLGQKIDPNLVSRSIKILEANSTPAPEK